MSITDELRDITKDYAGYKCIMFIEKGELLTIADRIDVEHERECKEQYACGAEHGIAASIEASMLQDHGYIALPKDADGEYIRIGDRMEHIELGYVLEVIAVGVDCFIAWNTHANRYCQYDSTLFRHHHEPTVEDVLDEFASAYDRIGGEDEEHQKYLDLIAEYAAKLQLKDRE